MTSPEPTIDIQDHPLNKTNTPPSFQVHPIEVSLNNLDSNMVHLKDICAVLPAYNEELVIGSVVLRTKQYVNRVIVVDDGSSDRTAEVAKLAGAEVIRLEHNTGKAYTILLGLRRARETGCTVAVMLDADGQHDPIEIQRVAGLVRSGKADLVIGSRFLDKSKKTPVYRRFGQKILDTFTNISTNTKVTDSQSGFRALSYQALNNLDFKSDGYNVESDMIAHFSKLGLSIEEVPISVNYDVPHKHKKHPLTHGVGVFTRLINLIAYQRPLLLFGIIGAVLVIIGLLTGYSAFSEYSITSKFPFAMSMISMLFLIMGMLMVIAGLLLNTLLMIMQERRH
jgi:glycosyltransferase involved in cell wall biosynthesis